MEKIRVLIVDDSAVVRGVIGELLSTESAIEVVATAEDPYEAREKIKQYKPDVITLDIEMPRMDGITFLRNLMKLNPLPVVMLSSLTHDGAEASLHALELGAVDYIPKPAVHASDETLHQFQFSLIEKVKAAAQSSGKLKFHNVQKGENVSSEQFKSQLQSVKYPTFSLIAIGASTGGTEALKDLLAPLPDNLPPIVVTQHIPETFSERFANRLNEQCDIHVSEAKSGQLLENGHVYIAPGSHHVRVKKHGHRLILELDGREPVNRHKPSVEVMFDSLIKLEPEHVTAVMLTGMGEDGSMAMKRLHDAGAYTIVQDEASSLVWGMPGAAYRYGAAKEVVSLTKMPSALVRHLTAS